jgi:hypothetical protein
MKGIESDVMLLNILDSLATFNGKPTLEKEIQTNVEIDDLLRMELELT